MRYILTALAIALGFLALIIPGIILSMGLAFVPYLVVDRGLGPIEAMKESWRITKGHKWQLLLLFLALLGINLLGILALIIGIFVTVPITMLAFAHAYRTLNARTRRQHTATRAGRPQLWPSVTVRRWSHIRSKGPSLRCSGGEERGIPRGQRLSGELHASRHRIRRPTAARRLRPACRRGWPCAGHRGLQRQGAARRGRR